MKLRVRGVEKSFGDKHVLRGIDLDVAEHEVVCLIGASGSGKSTLLKCVNLLVPTDAGEVWLDDILITAPRVDADAVRSRMAIVFQSFNLFPHLSVLENITLAPVKVLDVPRAEAVARADDLLERFGLADKRGEYPELLSGGQQQRVAIIRALAMQPEVLLLDEVTSALDPVLVGEVLSLLRDLKSQGMTMVIATHEMGFARESADRVAFLHDGIVAEAGPPDEIFGNPTQAETQEFLRRIIDAGRL
ncbi:MAG TPA: amino acid ABC transporter ATP-binding protein [Acidimicrobiia bacterium]|nr:amino acid ABC transporter ATP-binding protein [Acidimicrobiia bacterium]